MGTPVAILKRIMPAAEFERWVQFDAEEPIGDRANHHWPVASLAALVFNRTLQKGEKPRKPSDFLLWPEPQDVEPDDDGVSLEALMGDGW